MDDLPTSNPRAGYLALKPAIDAAIQRVLDSPAYVLGPEVAAFEEAFARYLGACHAIGVNSGTDALHLALRALGIGPGDEVIAPSHTAVATVAAIEMSGASAVLVDIEAPWRTLDPVAAAAAIGPRTRAVIAVHLYGQPADLDGLGALCRAHRLALIEDCAQAAGARWRAARVGTVGVAAAFSFYPTKNLGAIGDGGMVVTGDAALAGRVRQLRQYGWDEFRCSIVPGCNSRLDPLQAAVLQVKLPLLDDGNARRRALAARYAAGLTGLPVQLPAERPGSTHAWHLYVIELPDKAMRDALLGHLRRLGIIAGIHYPVGAHAQPAYAGRLRTGPLPVTERLTATILTLPLYPELGEAAEDRVIAAVRGFFGGSA
jgi:dTDP-4-amino-4,6-dideoxygalactose transaminase